MYFKMGSKKDCIRIEISIHIYQKFCRQSYSFNYLFEYIEPILNRSKYCDFITYVPVEIICVFSRVDFYGFKGRLYPKWHAPYLDVGLLGGSRSKISKSLLEK